MTYRWTEAAAHEPRPVSRPPATWLRVSRQRPCPICGKPDWCSITEDGAAACCMRISEGAVAHVDQGHGVGHIHQLDASEALPLRFCESRPAVGTRTERPAFALDYGAILRRWRACTSTEAIQALAAGLGVSRESLERLEATWAPERAAWAFPMHDDRRQVVGIRLRGSQGQKFALNGSHAGVFLPRGLDSRSTLLICEGPTDTAAALTLGYQAVGRPSCSGGTNILCDMLQAGRRRDVVILADSDGPGRCGARQLADRIVGIVRSFKVIAAAPHKDIREWLQAGVGRDCVDVRIAQANWYRVADPQNGDRRHDKWPAQTTTW